MNFIDICGASGTAYRFRRWPDVGAHPPMAGNFVVVAPGDRAVVTVGVLEDLSQASSLFGDGEQAFELFTRLNIGRRNREAEHEDLIGRHPGAAMRVDAAGSASRAA